MILTGSLVTYQRGFKPLVYWTRHTQCFITACVYIYIRNYIYTYTLIEICMCLTGLLETTDVPCPKQPHLGIGDPGITDQAGRIETQLLKGMDASDVFSICIPVVAFDEAIFSCSWWYQPPELSWNLSQLRFTGWEVHDPRASSDVAGKSPN